MSVYDLREFGWEDCIVPVSLDNICKHIPIWKNIQSLRSHTINTNTQLFFPKKFFNSETMGMYMPGYMKGKIVNRGSYATIFKGKRSIFTPTENKTEGIVNMRKKTDFELVCIKEIRLQISSHEKYASTEIKDKAYEDEINAIIYEAFLHALLLKTFESHGFPTVVPKLFEMLLHTTKDTVPPLISNIDSVWLGMEFIQGSTLEDYLTHNLIPTNSEFIQKRNQKILVDVFLQLAYFLHIVQENLRFNHRDMKINNLLIRSHDSLWHRVLSLQNGKSYSCMQDIVFIDFGFSCIACDKMSLRPKATLIGAGNWFRPEHDCFKYGRDIAQFIYSVHCTFPLKQYVSNAFFDSLYKTLIAINDSVTVPILNGFNNSGVPNITMPDKTDFNNGIYIFMRESNIDVPGCSPVDFIKTLEPYYI
jgi:serine/threonine protein kinase